MLRLDPILSSTLFSWCTLIRLHHLNEIIRKGFEMNTKVLSLGLGLLVGLVALSAQAAAFDPAVKISNIQGNVTVKVPGSAEFVKAEEGKSYPFGTIFQSGEGATATAQLADGTKADLTPESMVKFTQEGNSGDHVVMAILSGRVDLAVAEGFENSGGKLEVLWRGGYVLAVKAGEYTIETAVESELRLIAITVKSGEGALAGPDYEISVLPPGAGVSIASNPNLTFLRIRCFAGEFGVTVLDESLRPRVITLTEGRVIKILRKLSATADAVIATIMEIDEDNNIIRADTYTITIEGDSVRVLWESKFENEVSDTNEGGSLLGDSKDPDKDPGTTTTATTTTTTTDTTTDVGDEETGTTTGAGDEGDDDDDDDDDYDPTDSSEKPAEDRPAINDPTKPDATPVGKK